MIEPQVTTPIPPDGYSDLTTPLGKSIGAYWEIFLAEGVVLIALGSLAILAPAAATPFICGLFLFAGVSGLNFSC
jgi:uncharacterized membrane protein HdeD (DUF308 family)